MTVFMPDRCRAPRMQSHFFAPGWKLAIFILPLLSCAFLADAGNQPATRQAPPQRASQVQLYSLPMQFEPNMGQVEQEEVKFISRGPGYDLFLTSTQAVLAMRPARPRQRPGGDTPHWRHWLKEHSSEAARPPATLRMSLIGATGQAQIGGEAELPGKVNYFLGNEPGKWRSAIPTYARVKYNQVYPGVDLVYYGNQKQLEYDFVVKEGADPGSIRLAFDGADRIETDGSGGIVAEVNGVSMKWGHPYAYQDTEQGRQEVAARFVVGDDRNVAFELASYDTRKPLVIDPALVYVTYLGGSGDDHADGIAVDGSGNVYVVGDTSSLNYPTRNAYQSSPSGTNQVVVTKLNPSGTALIYSTYLGGSAADYGGGIAIDTSSNAYVTGWTYSANFPAVNAYSSGNSGISDAFISKLSPSGTSLLYSSYLGGAGQDTGLCIAVGTNGNAYIGGQTYSVTTGANKFPVVNAYQKSNGGDADAFVARFDTTSSGSSSLIFSTFLGGVTTERANGIAVDSAGNAYITGQVDEFPSTYPYPPPSSDFPVVNAFQPVFSPGTTNDGEYSDAFVSEISATGSSLIFSTFLGAEDIDEGWAIALGPNGRVYVIGETGSTNFPVLNAAQSMLGGGVDNFSVPDAFITILSSNHNSLYYSTYLGGAGFESALGIFNFGIAVDNFGAFYVTGYTDSTADDTNNPANNFPLTSGADQTEVEGGYSAFITKINPAVPGPAGLIYSTFLGGDGADNTIGMAVGSGGNFYVAGDTSSVTNLATSGVFQRTNAGGTLGPEDIFVARYTSPPDLSISMIPSTDPVVVGTNLTYTIYVNNNSALTGVTGQFTGVSNYVQFSTNAGIVSVTAPGSTWTTSRNSNGTFVYFVPLNGNLTNNASTIQTVVITNKVPGLYTNIAVIAGTPPTLGVQELNTNNNISSVLSTVQGIANVRIPSMTISPNPVLMTSNLTYTIQVANKGPNNATSVTLTDALPASVTYVSYTSTIGSGGYDTNYNVFFWGADTLTNNTSATITITATTTIDGPISNYAIVGAFEVDLVPSDNVSTMVSSVTPLANLALGMTGPAGPIFTGNSATYNMLVTNFGPSQAPNTVITNFLPAGVSFVSSIPAASPVTNNGVVSVALNLGTLATNSIASASVTVNLLAAGIKTNTAYVSSAAADSTPANSTASVATTVVAGADLGILQLASTSSLLVASNMTFTINVTNAGFSTATNVVVADPLPAGFVFLSQTPFAGSTFIPSGNLLQWSSFNLANGASATATVNAKAVVDGVYTNTVSVQSSVSDPQPANNTSSISVTVAPNPNVPVLKITRSGANVVLSWSTNLATSYFLQSTTNLAPGGVWTTNNLVPRIVGNQYMVTNTITVPRIFYRLASNPLLSLNFLRQGTNFVLFWSALPQPPGVLKTTTNLATPIQWSVVTNSLALVGTSYYVTNTARGNRAFFMLFH